jgi:hypothetical protein
MVRTLLGSGAKVRRLPLPSVMYASKDRELGDDIALQHGVAEKVGSRTRQNVAYCRTLMFVVQLIAERVANPIDTKDLLNVMLKGKDPVTSKINPRNVNRAFGSC